MLTPPGTKATREAGGLLSGAPPTREVLSNVLSPCSHGYKPRSPSFCDFPLSFFLGDSDGKGSTCSAGDLDLIPGPGRSPGEGNGYPLLYSCLENPMDRGAWWVTVHRFARVSHDLATKQWLNKSPLGLRNSNNVTITGNNAARKEEIQSFL